MGEFCNSMFLFSVAGLFGGVLAQGAVGCYWAGGLSGANIECMPNHYIDGVCGSGSRNDCKEGRTKYSFLIRCCPDGAMVNSGPRNDCQWLAGNQGDNVTCPNAQLAFGHCQTSQASLTGNAGDCHKSSVEVMCCDSVELTTRSNATMEQCSPAFDAVRRAAYEIPSLQAHICNKLNETCLRVRRKS